MPRTPTCSDCGTTEGVAIYNLCRPCLETAAAEMRAAQGLPPKVTEPSIIEMFARFFNEADAKRAAEATE
jgi:hypothetical protein